jgi:hypothetical protein
MNNSIMGIIFRALIMVVVLASSIITAQAQSVDEQANKNKFDHWGRPLDSQNCKTTKTFIDPRWPGEIALEILENNDYPPERQGHLRGKTSKGGLGERWVLCQFDLPKAMQEFEFITSGTVVNFTTWDGTTGSGGLGVYFYDHLPQVDWGRTGEPHSKIERFNIYGQYSVNFEGGVHNIKLKSPSNVLAIGVRLRDAWKDTIVNFDMEWSFIREK